VRTFETRNYEEAFSFTYQEKEELETRIEELEDEVEMELKYYITSS